MRKLLIIAFILVSFQAMAQTKYYVSNAGSDAANGLTTGTSWKTLNKINSSSFASGDSIFFKRGDTWVERLNVPSSGIYFGAYGTGAKPLITALKTLTGFTNEGGNIWSVTASASVPKLNTVLIDGKIRAKGRYPNTGYLTFTSYSGKYQITGGLSGTPNYKGAECVVRSAHWILDVVKISSQSGGVLNFRDSLTYVPSFGGNGYFIQNTPSVLDISGEWAYDSMTKVLKVYSILSPDVQISTIDTLVYISSKDNTTFNGISFTGANMKAIQIDTSRNVSVVNCLINNSGAVAISGKKSAYFKAEADSILNSWSNAIFLRSDFYNNVMIDTCNNATVSSNYIKNTGSVSGMGRNGNGTYTSVYIVGDEAKITANMIDSTGYNGIMFNGNNSFVYVNYISTFNYVKDDGSGIYTVIGAYLPLGYNDGSIVRKNIVANGVGANAGTSNVSNASGIYLDDLTSNTTVDSNTVYNTFNYGIFLHGATGITVTNNTVYSSSNSLSIRPEGTEPTNDLVVGNNTFYVIGTTNYNIFVKNTGIGSRSLFGNNYYSKPSNEEQKFKLISSVMSLPDWQTTTGQDLISKGSPDNITNDAAIFYMNPTMGDSTIDLPYPGVDSKGYYYENTITLRPFTSLIIYKAQGISTINRRLKIGWFPKN